MILATRRAACGASLVLAAAIALSAHVYAEPMPTRPLEVLRLLRARQFPTLTRAIESTQAALERDVRRENDLAALVSSFDRPDPGMTPLLDEWVRTAPTSFAPRLARAVHRAALAWSRRGAKDADGTTPEQFADMDAILETAVDDARAVIARNPKVVEAHRVMIETSMAFGDQETCAMAAAHGIARLPASLRIRTALATCFLPRWGGNVGLLEELAREADEHVKENPRLTVMHGFVDWDRGNLAESGSDEEMDYYDRAIRAGAFSLFHYDRAHAHLLSRRYIQALEDTNKALELTPDDPPTLVVRARALEGLGRHAEAVATVRLLEEIDPAGSNLAAFRRGELKESTVAGHQLYVAGDYPRSIDRFTRGIELTGGNAEIHYWRGRAYLRVEDPARALSDFERAVGFDARHFESYRNIDFILARGATWDCIINYWTAYIAAAPTDGRAYYERAGTKHRKRDFTGALQDAKRACDLGTTDACTYVRHAASY
jgi:tetratricopeptide (TPR) repeat protein